MAKSKLIMINKDAFNIQEIQSSMSEALTPMGNWSVMTTGNSSLVVSKGIWVGKYNFIQSGDNYISTMNRGFVNSKPLPAVLILIFGLILFPFSVVFVLPFIIKINSLNKRFAEVLSRSFQEKHSANIV